MNDFSDIGYLTELSKSLDRVFGVEYYRSEIADWGAFINSKDLGLLVVTIECYMEELDKSDLEYDIDKSDLEYDIRLIDEKKFMLSKIKYGF